MSLTGMAASNTLGEELAMFLVGKYAKPRCFKNFYIYHVVTGLKEALKYGAFLMCGWERLIVNLKETVDKLSW